MPSRSVSGSPQSLGNNFFCVDSSRRVVSNMGGRTTAWLSPFVWFASMIIISVFSRTEFFERCACQLVAGQEGLSDSSGIQLGISHPKDVYTNGSSSTNNNQHKPDSEKSSLENVTPCSAKQVGAVTSLALRGGLEYRDKSSEGDTEFLLIVENPDLGRESLHTGGQPKTTTKPLRMPSPKLLWKLLGGATGLVKKSKPQDSKMGANPHERDDDVVPPLRYQQGRGLLEEGIFLLESHAQSMKDVFSAPPEAVADVIRPLLQYCETAHRVLSASQIEKQQLDSSMQSNESREPQQPRLTLMENMLTKIGDSLGIAKQLLEPQTPTPSEVIPIEDKEPIHIPTQEIGNFAEYISGPTKPTQVLQPQQRQSESFGNHVI